MGIHERENDRKMSYLVDEDDYQSDSEYDDLEDKKKELIKFQFYFYFKYYFLFTLLNSFFYF